MNAKTPSYTPNLVQSADPNLNERRNLVKRSSIMIVFSSMCHWDFWVQFDAVPQRLATGGKDCIGKRWILRHIIIESGQEDLVLVSVVSKGYTTPV